MSSNKIYRAVSAELLLAAVFLEQCRGGRECPQVREDELELEPRVGIGLYSTS